MENLGHRQRNDSAGTMMIGLLNRFQPRCGDESDGDSGNAFDLDNNALAFLDALDGTFRSFEVAVSDADTLAWFGKEVGVFKILDAFVLLGCHLDEVLHLAV